MNPYYEPYWLNDEELEHYGVKGMRWGVVNEDKPASRGSSNTFRKTSAKTGSGFSPYKQSTKNQTPYSLNEARNIASYQNYGRESSTGRGKYSTKTTKNDRIIKMPPGYSTTSAQKKDFYSKFGNSGGYSGADSRTIPGAVIYTYKTLVDSPTGQDILKSQESAYDDCIIKSVEVDWDTGVLTEHKVTAKDHDQSNIVKYQGSHLLSNWKNNVALAQRNSAIKAQSRAEKAKDIVMDVLKKAGGAATKVSSIINSKATSTKSSTPTKPKTSNVKRYSSKK